jgi:hypothetical protein
MEPQASEVDKGIEEAQAARTSVSPNSVSDQPATKDALGFEPYVNAVGAFLMHQETLPPLTLSVEGSWGSGKSSFMLQLEKYIKSKGAKTVWFNAWRHDKEEELWAAFALHFTGKLASEFPRWKRWLLHGKLAYLRFDWQRGWFSAAKFLILGLLFVYISVAIGYSAASAHSPFKALFSPVANNDQSPVPSEASKPKKEEEFSGDLLMLLLRVGGGAGYILLGFAILRKISEVVGNPLKVHLTNYIQDPKYETKSAFIETFHSDFQLLVKTYCQGKRVVVLIDDLDRCEVPKAAELMQALNLLISESAPVIYVLGLDREKIAAGLAVKYEKLLPYLAVEAGGRTGDVAAAGLEFGYTYLEKFIQLPFLVPQADTDIDPFLNSLGAAASQRGTGTPAADVDPGLLVELSADSERVRHIVKMVAPALEYNPRRLKQFLNLFRLRALLASQTGLFGPPSDPERYNPLTLEQLGKLVAIILRWPLLVVDLEAKPDLLTSLQQYAWGNTKSNIQVEAVEQFWRDKQSLRSLMAYPTMQPGVLGATYVRERYRLDRVDIQRFQRISPLVAGREPAPEGSATNARQQRTRENEPAAPYQQETIASQFSPEDQLETGSEAKSVSSSVSRGRVKKSARDSSGATGAHSA